MKRFAALALVLGVALASSACDDSFLTTVPPDQLSDEVFWTQEKDAILSVNALYPLLFGYEVTEFDAASDNAWAHKSFDDWYLIGNGTLDAANGTVENIFNQSYQAIRRANELLANIDRIPEMNEQLRDRIKGEARFHRAYHYMMLANLFGDVPLVLEPISIPESQELTRTPRAQVIDQVLADLDFAASVLPVSYPESERGRVTRGAAYALKARAALWESRWDVAAAAAAEVMKPEYGYELYPDYTNLFRYAGEDNPEIILAERYMKGQRSHGVFADYAPRSMLGGSTIVPLRSLVDSYTMIDGLPIDESPLYDPENPYENRDLRMYGTLLYPGAIFDGEVYNSLPDSPTPDRVKNDFNATATGYQQIKYVDPADREDPNNSGLDFIILRYADVLLMYAEAKVELNQIDQSVYDALNLVRDRAGLPPITGSHSQAELREIVRHERRVELALEGLRLFDIRRWRIAEQVMPGRSYGIDYINSEGEVETILADNRFFDPARDYLWPIPLKELDLNPDLGQNPGY
ncbi:MAG TPA: RagB/SusD family nutrient uptake outer membrane protein [Longimicrobiaceae bacterium]